MNKILITGIGGYIGSTIAKELLNDFWIVGYGRGTRFPILKEKFGDAIELIEGYTNDEDTLKRAVRGIDVVINCAGIAGNKYCLDNPWSALEANVRGVDVLARLISKSPAKPFFIHISTQSVYGTFKERPMPLTEDMEMMPDDLYGATKAEGEIYAGEVPSVILRLTNLYGYGAGIGHEKNIVSRFAQMAREDKDITLFGDGSQGIDFVHVEDVAHAVKLIIEGEKKTGIYNVGSGFATPMRDVADAVSKASKLVLGKKPNVVYAEAPPDKIWPSRWVSIEKIKEIVPHFSPRSFEEGAEELMRRMF